MYKQQSGMTLVELMVVVMIVAILASIAMPAYRSYVIRANRSEAKTALLFNAGALERCFTRYNSYAAAAGCTVTFPVVSQTGLYEISDNGTAAAGRTFTLTATRKLGQVNDSECGDFTLNNVGTRNVTNASKDQKYCWGR